MVADLIGAGRIGPVRLRGSTSFEIAPETRFRAAELSGYWSASENADWEGAIAFDARQNRARARVSHVRRLSSMAVAVTGEAATDGSLALGFNLNFSLDPRRGLHMSRQPLAGAGIVRARVFRDFNDNGTRDSGEPLEKGAFITTGALLSPNATDSKGSVTVGGLATYAPLTVGIDQTSLADPMLAPRKAIQVVVPRPGIPAEVDIALVGAGDVEGAILKSGGLGFEGLDLELVDENGERRRHRAHRFRRLLPVRARGVRPLYPQDRRRVGRGRGRAAGPQPDAEHHAGQGARPPRLDPGRHRPGRSLPPSKAKSSKTTFRV